MFLSKKFRPAQDVFNQAIAQNNALAMVGLAMMFTEKGPLKDHKKSVMWLTKAAEAGSVQGMAFLAEGYQHGEFGLAISGVKAVEWYIKAAEAGASHLFDSLALIYAAGIIVPKSSREAAYWQQRSVEANK